MCQFLLYSKVTLLYLCVHSFLFSFPLWFIPGDWIQFSVLHSRTSFISSRCNSFHLLSPNSLSNLLPYAWMQTSGDNSPGSAYTSQGYWGCFPDLYDLTKLYGHCWVPLRKNPGIPAAPHDSAECRAKIFQTASVKVSRVKRVHLRLSELP